MKLRLKKFLQYLKVFVGLSLIGLLFYKFSIWQAIEIIKNASLYWIVAVIFINGIGIAISAMKLQLLTRIKQSEIKFNSILKAYYIGFFFNNFMPTDVGGDVFKIRELEKNNVSLKDATIAVFLERFSGIFIVLLTLLVFSIPKLGMFKKFGVENLRVPFQFLVIIFGFFSVLAYLGWQRGIKSFAESRKVRKQWNVIYRIIETFYAYRNNLKIIYQLFLISFIFCLLRTLNCVLVAKSLGHTLPFIPVFAAVQMVTLLSLIPVSIGSLGIREGGLIFCFIKLGIVSPEALSIALILRLCGYIHSGVGGLLYFLRK